MKFYIELHDDHGSFWVQVDSIAVLRKENIESLGSRAVVLLTCGERFFPFETYEEIGKLIEMANDCCSCVKD